MKRIIFFLLLLSAVCKAQDKPELILPLVNTEMTRAVFSQDNKHLLTYSDKLILWDAATARVLNSIEIFKKEVWFADFIENDRSIIAVTGKEIKVWDTKTAIQKYILKGHTKLIYSTLLSEDKKKLITISEDNTIKIWSLQPGKLLRTIALAADKHSKQISMNADGSILAVSSFIDNPISTRIDIWNINTGQKIKQIEFEGFHKYMLFTKKRGLLISTSEHMYFIDPTKWESHIVEPEIGESSKAILSPNQEVLASITGTYASDAEFSLSMYASEYIDIYEGKRLKRKFNLNHDEDVPAYEFLNDSLLVSSTTEGEIFYWNINTGTEIERSETNVRGYNQVFAVSKDRSKFCLVSSQNRQLFVYIWDTYQRQLLSQYSTNIREITDISVSGSGDSIFFNNEKSLKIWNAVRIENIPAENLLDEQKGELKGFLSKYSRSGGMMLGSANDELDEVFVDWKRKRVFTLHNFVRDTLKVWDMQTGDRLPLHYEKNIDIKRNGIIDAFTGRVVPYSQFLPYSYARISNDASLLFTSFKDETFTLWNLDSNRIILSDSIATVEIISVKFDPDNKYLYLVGDNDSLYKYVINERKVAAAYKVPTEDSWILNSHCSSILNDAGKITDLATGKTIMTLPDLASEQKMIFSNDDSLIAYCTDDYIIKLWGTKENRPIASLKGHQGKIIGLTFVKKKSWLISSSSDNTVRIWDTKQEKLLATFILFNESDFIIYLPSGYYMATKGAVGYLSFRTKGKLFPVQQFDGQFNRPDKVLEALGNKDTTLINLYRTAYQKRIQRAGIKETMLTNNLFHLPEIELVNETAIPSLTSKKTLNVNFKASDNQYKLNRYYVWINDIPIGGSSGVNIEVLNKNLFQTTIPISLNIGFNKVQISCINGKGVESLKQTFYTNYLPEAKQQAPKIFYIGIGVSNYSDSNMNLQYAFKDARDLDSIFKSNYNSNYISRIFADTNATMENIMSIKKVLAQSSIEDRVIISASGHGLLDKNNDFYFATYDIDFNSPSAKGLLYDSLEALLDNIPARKKLLLIDACHSGEVDKETLIENDTTGNVKTYGAKGLIVKPKKQSIGLQNSFELMRELFSDLSRSNGSVVISAAGGLEYALEDEKYNNGVFTYCIKKGLLDYEADKNLNGKITVNELKNYLSKMVVRLTQGRQKPTSRKETLEFDWIVW